MSAANTNSYIYACDHTYRPMLLLFPTTRDGGVQLHSWRHLDERVKMQRSVANTEG